MGVLPGGALASKPNVRVRGRDEPGGRRKENADVPGIESAPRGLNARGASPGIIIAHFALRVESDLPATRKEPSNATIGVRP